MVKREYQTSFALAVTRNTLEQDIERCRKQLDNDPGDTKQTLETLIQSLETAHIYYQIRCQLRTKRKEVPA